MNRSNRVVFVCGLHRSGTTPLARVLAAHPQVSGFSGTGVKEDEGQHLQDVYPPAREYGGAGRFARDPRAHLTESSPLVTPENASRLWEQWARHWDLSRPVLLEKSPPNLVRMRFLQALFPEASFLVVVRHPIVVALSTSRWRRATSVESLVEHWLIAHEHLVADAPFVRRLHAVAYEELVARPKEVLQGVGEFLQLEGPVPHDGLSATRSDRYERRWAQLRASRMPWQRRTISRMRRQYEHRLLQFGYELDDLRAVRLVSVMPRGPA